MKLYLEAFLRLIYPASCGVCETLLELNEEGLCGPCHGHLAALRFSPEKAVLEKKMEAVDEGWTLFPYESPVKEILTAIKFSKKRWLMRLFRSEIGPLAEAITAENHYDALVPVPIDRSRLLEREFNQSELVGNLIAGCTGVPLKTGFLRKRRSTPAQSQLSREERLANLRAAFEVRDPEGLRGKSVLLVDDIFTTGTTAEEAARTLKKGGAKRVDLFALARTGDPS